MEIPLPNLKPPKKNVSKQEQHIYLETASLKMFSSPIQPSTPFTLESMQHQQRGEPALHVCLSSIHLWKERALHPLVDRRDILSIAHTNMSTGLSSISKSFTLAEAENIRALAQNRETATTLLNLANQTKSKRANAIRDSNSSNQVKRLRADTKIARTRWRIMKSVVAAIIVGSGIDWAADTELRDLVLDEEDEGD